MASFARCGRPALAWDPDDFVTEQVFVTSVDGTPVPLFLTHRRDVRPTATFRRSSTATAAS